MYNLHTHSFYCGHGSGTIKEYADRAEEAGFDVLGFSEHIPFCDGFLSKSRMAFDDFALYESDVMEEKINRAFPVLLGYEVDYFDSRRAYYEEKLSFIAHYFDIYIDVIGEDDIRELIRLLEKSVAI